MHVYVQLPKQTLAFLVRENTDNNVHYVCTSYIRVVLIRDQVLNDYSAKGQ